MPTKLKKERGSKVFIGTLFDEDTLFMRVHVGDAKGIEGNAYEMSTNAGNGCPIIRSQKTGKWWTVTWTELLDLAVKLGVDKK